MTPDDAAAIRELDNNTTLLSKSLTVMGADLAHAVLVDCRKKIDDMNVDPIERVVCNAAIVGILTVLIDKRGAE